MVYAQDNDDSMMMQPWFWTPVCEPATANCGYGNATAFWWRTVEWDTGKADLTKGILTPYTKSGAILDCPTAAGITKTISSNGAATQGNGSKTLAVGTNPAILSTRDGAKSYTAVAQPAETVLFGDAVRYEEDWSSGSPVGPKQYFRTDALSSPSDFVAYGGGGFYAHGRHGGRPNIGWVDGHAKSTQVTDMGLDNAAVEENKKAQVGFIAHPKCPLRSECQDYYDGKEHTTS